MNIDAQSCAEDEIPCTNDETKYSLVNVECDCKSLQSPTHLVSPKAIVTPQRVSGMVQVSDVLLWVGRSKGLDCRSDSAVIPVL